MGRGNLRRMRAGDLAVGDGAVVVMQDIGREGTATVAGVVARLGVIGGSGLYAMADLTEIEERRVETPFGPPSDAITIGTLGGERVAFLPRHGRGHRLNPRRCPIAPTSGR